jgi:hypothetical protein
MTFLLLWFSYFRDFFYFCNWICNPLLQNQPIKEFLDLTISKDPMCFRYYYNLKASRDYVAAKPILSSLCLPQMLVTTSVTVWRSRNNMIHLIYKGQVIVSFKDINGGYWNLDFSLK